MQLPIMLSCKFHLSEFPHDIIIVNRCCLVKDQLNSHCYVAILLFGYRPELFFRFYFMLKIQQIRNLAVQVKTQ